MEIPSKMKSFQEKIVPFLNSVHSNCQLERWGVLFAAQNIGIVLHKVKKETSVPLSSLPKNIQLVHVWEDLWAIKSAIIKSRIYSLFGLSQRVFARKTRIIKLNKPESLAFLAKNHLNEPASGKFKYGLMLDDELIAVAVFSASCPVHRGKEVYRSHQLIRFCNKNGITVVGGLSKLIKHFIKEQSPEDIMTYADLDWSNGSGYAKIGFEKIGELPPQKFSIDANSLIRNYKIDTLHTNEINNLFTNQGSAKYLLNLKKNDW